MRFQSLLVVSAMALSLAGIASAKSWDITLDLPTTVGANQLKAGDYAVRLDGNQAVLTSEAHGTAIKIPVTVEHSDKKFDNTQLDATTKDGTETIQSIELGGSNTKLVLNK